MSNNHIGQIRPLLSTPPTASPYSNTHTTQVEKEEFEKSLETPLADGKKGWDAANEKQFGLSMFQMEHGRSMAHEARMKEIWNSMDDTGKSKSHHRQG